MSPVLDLVVTGGALAAAAVWAFWAFAGPARPLSVLVAVAILAPRAAVPSGSWVAGGLTVVEFGIGLALMTAGLRALRGGARLPERPVLAALAAFLVVQGIAYAGSNPSPVPQQQRAFAGLMAAVPLALLPGWSLPGAPERSWVARVFVGATTAAAALALALNAAPESVARTLLGALEPLGYPADATVIRYVVGTEVRRATGTAVDPNLLGGSLALALPLLAGHWVATSARPVRLALILAGLVLVGALAMTYSRAAWLGALAGVGLTALLLDRRLALAAVAVTAVALAGPWGEPLRDRLAGGLLWSDPAAVMRLGEYADTIGRIAHRPLLGVGFGTPEGMNPLLRVSSVYLLIAEQSGLAGLAAFLAVPGAVLWHTYRVRQIPGAGWAAQAGVAGSLVAALTTGLFDHYFGNYGFLPSVALFWTVVGLAAWRPGVRRGG